MNENRCTSHSSHSGDPKDLKCIVPGTGDKVPNNVYLIISQHHSLGEDGHVLSVPVFNLL